MVAESEAGWPLLSLSSKKRCWIPVILLHFLSICIFSLLFCQNFSDRCSWQPKPALILLFLTHIQTCLHPFSPPCRTGGCRSDSSSRSDTSWRNKHTSGRQEQRRRSYGGRRRGGGEIVERTPGDTRAGGGERRTGRRRGRRVLQPCQMHLCRGTARPNPRKYQTFIIFLQHSLPSDSRGLSWERALRHGAAAAQSWLKRGHQARHVHSPHLPFL